MPSHLHIDLESRSTVDLKKRGVYVYAEHETTDVWCAAYAFDDDDVRLWVPGEPCPADIAAHVLEGGILVAHNANFERVMWHYILARRYGWPEPDTTQFRCTMIQAYAMALPGDLDGAAAAVRIETRKDAAGKRLMLQMARPRKVNADGSIVWWDDEEKRQRLYAYCKQDVEVEREIGRRLRPLKDTEIDLWHLDQTINDRGVAVDVTLCEAAKRVVEAAEEKLDARMREVTNFAVTACSNRNQLIAWVREQGVETDSLKKDVLEEMLLTDLPADVREALLLRQQGSKASVAKIDALLAGRNADGRARGLLQFNAATPTARWAGRRFQPQNIVRPDEEFDVDFAIDAICGSWSDMVYDDGIFAVSQCLRGMIVAGEGKRILAADYSNIEGRVLAWLAGEQWKLDAFRAFDAGRGPDLYKVAYARSYGMSPADVAKPQRQIGKVMELALGFQGGVGAFLTMGANYGVDLPVEQVEGIRDSWRAAHPQIKQFWWDLEAAAIAAVENPGSTHVVRDLVFRVAGSFLFVRLPSKRFMVYPYPKVMPKKMPWKTDDGRDVWKDSLTYFSTIDVAKRNKIVDDPNNSSRWARIASYGGMLAENATQATARDVLADAMPRLEAAGYPIILTVHDEVVCEAGDGHGSLAEVIEIMETLPGWMSGCPITAAGFEGRRYRK